MFNETHHLIEEFPEFKEKIQELKSSNKHFKHLFDKYEELDKEIHSVAQEVRAISDEHAEELKKKRLKLKDELYAILLAE